jgi:hypothetical protein
MYCGTLGTEGKSGEMIPESVEILLPTRRLCLCGLTRIFHDSNNSGRGCGLIATKLRLIKGQRRALNVDRNRVQRSVEVRPTSRHDQFALKPST